MTSTATTILILRTTSLASIADLDEDLADSLFHELGYGGVEAGIVSSTETSSSTSSSGSFALCIRLRASKIPLQAEQRVSILRKLRDFVINTSILGIQLGDLMDNRNYNRSCKLASGRFLVFTCKGERALAERLSDEIDHAVHAWEDHRRAAKDFAREFPTSIRSGTEPSRLVLEVSRGFSGVRGMPLGLRSEEDAYLVQVDRMALGRRAIDVLGASALTIVGARRRRVPMRGLLIKVNSPETFWWSNREKDWLCSQVTKPGLLAVRFDNEPTVPEGDRNDAEYDWLVGALRHLGTLGANFNVWRMAKPVVELDVDVHYFLVQTITTGKSLRGLLK